MESFIFFHLEQDTIPCGLLFISPLANFFLKNIYFQKTPAPKYSNGSPLSSHMKATHRLTRVLSLLTDGTSCDDVLSRKAQRVSGLAFFPLQVVYKNLQEFAHMI